MRLLRKWWFYLLVGIGFLFLGFLTPHQSLSAINIAYPLRCLGNWLRDLYYLNAAGEVFAYILYVLLCLLPLFLLLFFIIRKKSSVIHDIFLPLLSAYLFVAMFLFINPQYFASSIYPYGSIGTDYFLGGLGMVGCSVLLFYLIFYALDRKADSRHKSIAVSYSIVLALGFISLYADVSQALYDFDSGGSFGYIANIIEDIAAYVLISLICETARDLFDASGKNEIMKDVSSLSRKLTVLSFALIITTIALDLISNIITLITGPGLTMIGILIKLPAGYLLLAFVCLGLSSYFRKAEDLKEDHDLTI